MIGDEIKSLVERHALHVCGGKAESGIVKRDEGVCLAVRSEVNGDMSGGGESLNEVGIVRPGREGRPVESGVRDEAGFVLGDVISQKLE